MEQQLNRISDNNTIPMGDVTVNEKPEKKTHLVSVRQ